MKSQRILEALGQVDETFIVEAAPLEKRKKRRLVKWGALAACLCLVFAAGALSFIIRSKETEKHYTVSSMADISANYHGVLLANNLSFTGARSQKIVLSYAGDGSPYNARDWNTLTVSADYIDCAVVMNCIFDHQDVSMDTESAIDQLQYGDITVYLYQDDIASGFQYAYRAEFEYSGVFYVLQTNSNDPSRIYSVLETITGTSQADDSDNTFTGILGLDGYYVKIEETPPGFMIWRYFAELHGKTQCIAEVFGYTASEPEVYSKDLDGDGVTELICNCTFGTGAERVYIYRNHHGVIEQGTLVYDTNDPSIFPNLNNWGSNAINEKYDPENDAFILSYSTDTGTEETILYDKNLISYHPFVPEV